MKIGVLMKPNKLITTLLITLILFTTLYSNTYAEASKKHEVWSEVGNLSDVCFKDGKYFAVSYTTNGNTLCYSYDGQRWFPTGENFVCRLKLVNNQLVALCSTQISSYQTNYDKKLITSFDGVNWTSYKLDKNIAFRDYTYDGEKYIFVGENGIIATTMNFTSWDKKTIGSMARITSIANNQKTLVAVGTAYGSDGSPYEYYVTSQNGIDWVTAKCDEPVQDRTLCFNGKQFSLISKNSDYVVTSYDGLKWTKSATNLPRFSECYQVIWDGTQYIVAGAKDGTIKYENEAADFANYTSYIATSIDGKDWVARYDEPSSCGFNSICWNGIKYLAVGNDVALSYDMTNWEVTQRYYLSSSSDVIWDGSKFIAVCGGGPGVITSLNGLNWEESDYTQNSQNSEVKVHLNFRKAYDQISYNKNNNIYVASSSQYNAISSKEGCYWRESAESEGICITNNGQIFVSIGLDHEYKVTSKVSSDGVNWKTYYIDANLYPDCIVSNGDMFVLAGGASGINSLLTSYDGIKWQKQKLPSNVFINKIIWDGKQFVGIGEEVTSRAFDAPETQVIISSRDGKKWNITKRLESGLRLTAIAWNGEKYIAAGQTLTSGIFHSDTIIESNDCKSWNTVFSGTNINPTAIAFNSTKTIIVGFDGILVCEKDKSEPTVQYNVKVNNNLLIPDTLPVMDNNTLYVPEVVMKALGAEVKCDSATNEVKILKDSKVIELQIENKDAKIIGNKKDLPPAIAKIINSKILLPIRYVAENFNLKFEWDSNTKTAAIWTTR